MNEKRAMRRRYSAAFKAQVVQQLLREEKSLTEVAAEHGIHSNQLRQWRRVALEGLPSLFTRQRAVNPPPHAVETQKLDELYAEIGRLTTQLTWLKRQYGLDMSERKNGRSPYDT
jgi:transposase-like protein